MCAAVHIHENYDIDKSLIIILIVGVFYLTVPNAPRSLMIVNVTDSTVSLSWMSPDKPNGIITQYQIQYWKYDSITKFTSLNISNAKLTYTVSGLTSNTEYVFRMIAFTVVGHGTFSIEITDYTSKLI